MGGNSVRGAEIMMNMDAVDGAAGPLVSVTLAEAISLVGTQFEALLLKYIYLKSVHYSQWVTTYAEYPEACLHDQRNVKVTQGLYVDIELL